MEGARGDAPRAARSYVSRDGEGEWCLVAVIEGTGYSGAGRVRRWARMGVPRDFTLSQAREAALAAARAYAGGGAVPPPPGAKEER